MTSDFAYIPDAGPPRVIRFAPAEFMNGPWVAVFNKESNLLIINQDVYATLSKEERVKLFKTRDAYTYLSIDVT